MIVGNVLYAMQFSPWLLFAGRCIAGLSGSSRSVISGEIARCYFRENLCSKLSLVGVAFGIGAVFGPVINSLFLSTDICVGHWHITELNMPGVYVAVIFALLQIAVFMLGHDLSKEYDPKEHLEVEEERTKRKCSDGV